MASDEVAGPLGEALVVVGGVEVVGGVAVVGGEVGVECVCVRGLEDIRVRWLEKALVNES